MPKVDITIRRKRPLLEPDEPPKGIIPPGKPPDYWGRRLPQGIGFWDLGEKWNGAIWETNDYAFVSPLIDQQAVATPPIGISPQIALSDIRVLENEILDTGVENFTSLYRKILKSRGLSFDIRVRGFDSGANLFQYWMPSAGDEWKEQGLTLTEEERTGSQLIIIDGFPEFNDVDIQFVPLEINDLTRVKITALPSYAAASVPFVLARNAKIFLIPAIINNQGLSEETVAGPPSYQEHIALNLIRRLRPRTDDPLAIFNASPANPPEAFTEALTRTLALSPSRTQTLRYAFSDASPNQLIGGGSFPAEPTSDGGWPAVGFYSASTVLFNSGILLGQLTGIIKQSGTYYYFWKNVYP